MSIFAQIMSDVSVGLLCDKKCIAKAIEINGAEKYHFCCELVQFIDGMLGSAE